MTFAAPVNSIMLALRAAGNLGKQHTISSEDAEAIITEAGKFAAEKLAPLNRIGDTVGATYQNGVVTTPPGWRDTYREWREAGWNSINGPEAFGGQALPLVMTVACAELWNAANLSFAVNPLLTNGAIEAIAAHAPDTLKKAYLPELVSGRWTGTMNLTEPQSGSDLSGLRCKAMRSGDGRYLVSGTKIYITYGEHDCSDNIIHLVLARLTDAPAGTRGLSLFLVPKYLPDGSHNDLRCAGIENKLGLHGSPTCAMVYGDKGGATAWLVGEENRGLQCMFTMMNNARLLVGVQGVGLAERATQLAFAYARERRQGRAPQRTEGQSAIIEHPDVQRMLVDMRAKTMAARLLCMATAAAIDEARLAEEAGKGSDQAVSAQARAALLTPLAKAFSTDVAVEVASLGVQVHGGMGYMEDAGAAQLLRDARILPIYEGTNGIQAADFMMRKVQLDRGLGLLALLEACQNDVSEAGQVAPSIAVPLMEALSFMKDGLPVLADLEVGRAHAMSHYVLQAAAAIVSGCYLLRATALANTGPQQQAALVDASSFMSSTLAGLMARYRAALASPVDFGLSAAPD